MYTFGSHKDLCDRVNFQNGPLFRSWPTFDVIAIWLSSKESKLDHSEVELCYIIIQGEYAIRH